MASLNTTTPEKTVRNSNLELLRIICMLLIVSHHYVVHSKLIAEDGYLYSSPTSWRSVFLFIFGAWGKTSINCFVLITGFFMCKSHITAKKFIKLLSEVMFYRIAINMILFFTEYNAFSVKDFLSKLLPIDEISTNFTSCYLVFFLLIPFINILIKNMIEKQHIYLLLTLTFTYVILGTLHRLVFNYISWFIILYLIASYIRLYPKKIFSSIRIWSIVLFVGIIMSISSILVSSWMGDRIGNAKHYPYFFISEPNYLFSFLVGISLFMIFNSIEIRPNKLINTVAASTFGVLCIHLPLREVLWHSLFNSSDHYYDTFMPIYAVCSVIVVFVICTLIDMIRIKLLEEPFLKNWDKYFDVINKKYNNLENSFLNKLKNC